MEEKKFDPYQFIGFILIAVILTWMLYRNGPAEEASTAKATTEEGATFNQHLKWFRFLTLFSNNKK